MAHSTLVTVAVVGLLVPTFARADGPPLALDTPPLATLDAAALAAVAAHWPGPLRAWLPPVDLKDRVLLDETRRAHLTIDERGRATWLLPRHADDAALDRALTARGAQRIPGKDAWVLPAADPELEATCRAAPDWLACRRPIPDEGVEPLPRRAPSSPTSGGWRLRVAPPRLRAFLVERMRAAARRRARWLDPEARRATLAAAEAATQTWMRQLAGLARLEGRIDPGPGLSAEFEVELDAALWARLDPRRERAAVHPRILGWSRTPALAQAWVRADPAGAQALLRRWVGHSVSGLGGDFSVLWLGIGSGCGGECAPGANASLFATAAAFHVDPEALSTIPGAVPNSTTTPGHLRVDTPTGPAEVRLDEDTLFVATGGALGEAAARRWSRCPASLPSPEVLLVATADLRAMRAALDVHGPATTAELRELGRLVDHAIEALRPHRWVSARVVAGSARVLRLGVESHPVPASARFLPDAETDRARRGDARDD